MTNCRPGGHLLPSVKVLHLNCCVFVTVLLLFNPDTSFGQKETGAIEGTIKESNGQSLPGVTITASSSSLIGQSLTVYTDSEGYYRFPALSSGTYDIKAELQGFQPVVQKGIRLFVGLTLTVNFQLEMTKLSELIEVSEEVPLIDITTTATTFTVTPELIENLPKLTRIQQILRYAPGVGDDLVAYGAAGEFANRIWIDGVDVVSPRAGGLYADYNYNWIQEVQVSGIGAPAEFGGFTGVVGNFTTRSGSDEFHGLFETFYQDENLSSTNLPDAGPDAPFKTYDFSAQLGGPIQRGKLWFFSGFEYPQTQTHPLGYDGVITERYPKFITKLTTRLNENNTLQGFVHWDLYHIDGKGAGFGVLPEATTTNECSEGSWNTTLISLFSSETTFEGRFGGFYAHCKDIEDNPEIPGHFDWGTGISSGNPLFRTNVTRFRPQVNSSISHHARNFIFGDHDFRFGIEFERSRADTTEAYNGGMFYYDYYGSPYYRYLYEGYSATEYNHRLSSYAEDNWKLNDRFTLSLGVRWDHNRGLTDGNTVFKTDPVGPRVGFIWNPTANNQTVIKVHYGDYYDGLLSRNFYNLRKDYPFRTTEQYDPESGKWIEIYRINGFIRADSKFKQPLLRQFTVGLDQVLPGNVAVGAHYIHRKWKNILEDASNGTYEPIPFVNPLTGENITLFNLIPGTEDYFFSNHPEIFRRYDGLEIVANKRFTNKFSVSGSFVYSKTKGNEPNNRLADLAFEGFLDDPNQRINFTGHSLNDPTFAWKIVGNYALPWGINSGWYLRHSSGDTWTPLFGARLNQGFIRILAEPVGSRRLAAQNLLDLRFEKEFQIQRGQVRFTADVFNVFNSDAPTAVENRLEFRNFGLPTSLVNPRQIRLGIRYTF
jgi:outer membrane receptor protein involved in Fe transport